MRRALAALILAIPPLAGAQDGPERAFVEIATERTSYYAQEVFELRLRLHYDIEFFADHAVQLFRRPLDVPIQVQAPWLRALPGAIALAGSEGAAQRAARRLSLALDGEVAQALWVREERRAGRRFAILEIARRFLAERAGELLVPAPELRFAFAQRFEEDLLQGRVALDRREALVRGQPLGLTILPLPEQGRPPDFGGAVGRFTVSATARPRALRAGESLKLALVIAGAGNLDQLAPPRLDELEGFHVYGRIEEREGARRIITYDLTPLSESVKAVPAIPLVFFDPTPPAGYRRVHTQPIALEVAARPAGARALVDDERLRLVPGEDDIYDLKAMAGSALARAPRHLSAAVLVSALLAPWLLALALVLELRRRESRRADPAGARARGAADAFHACASGAREGLAAALAEYLAARLRCPVAAVIAPELAARLAAAGVPAELADRAARALQSLVAARYGGRDGTADAQALSALVEALEHSFLDAEQTP